MSFNVGTAATTRAPVPRPAGGGPYITGTTTVGQALTCAPGQWTGLATLSYAYAWENSASGLLGAGNGGQTATYTLQVTDASPDKVRCRVTATSNKAAAAPASVVYTRWTKAITP